MKIVELVRIEENETWGTFGILKINKEAFCVTLELPDRLNRRNHSCIPAQQYTCERIVSTKFGRTFRVKDVPNRNGILFHAGNTISYTAGCILLGQYWSKFRGNRGILNSGYTFKKFMAAMANEDFFHLTISMHY
jgi:hypothetical protein